MFAIEIDFADDVTSSERLMVRRPFARIGSDESSHIVIEDFKDIKFDLLVYKEGGRQFHCKQIFKDANSTEKSTLDDSYESYAKFNLGTFKITIIPIDNDFFLKPNEAPDQAGIRILRQALTEKSHKYPALQSKSETPFCVSFSEGQEVYAGRSNQCQLRFDARDVSTMHARFGFEKNKFWVEDLGSTNGTFVEGQQISGRSEFEPGIPVSLGGSIVLVGLVDEQTESKMESINEAAPIQKPEEKFPIVIGASEIVRPARLVLSEGKWVVIGRDPKSDVWLGAPFVSREHCKVRLLEDGSVEIVDSSTNGTGYSKGLLKNGEAIRIANKPEILHFGSGLSIAICFDQSQEGKFLESGGDPHAFIPKEQVLQQASPSEPKSEPPSAPSSSKAAFTQIREPARDTIGDEDFVQQHEPEGIAYYLSIFGSLSLIAKIGFIFGFFALVVLFALVISLLWTLLR